MSVYQRYIVCCRLQQHVFFVSDATGLFVPQEAGGSKKAFTTSGLRRTLANAATSSSDGPIVFLEENNVVGCKTVLQLFGTHLRYWLLYLEYRWKLLLPCFFGHIYGSQKNETWNLIGSSVFFTKSRTSGPKCQAETDAMRLLLGCPRTSWTPL